MPSGAKKKKREKAKRRKEVDLSSNNHHPPPQDKELEQGFVMEEEEGKDGGGVETTDEISVSEVKDVSDDLRGEEASEVVVEEKLSKEVSLDPVTEQLMEASEVHQDSVPTSSLVYESEEVEEVGEGVPNMGTVIGVATIDMIDIDTEVGDARPPLLEYRASVWNCCGLLDVFKGTRG